MQFLVDDILVHISLLFSFKATKDSVSIVIPLFLFSAISPANPYLFGVTFILVLNQRLEILTYLFATREIKAIYNFQMVSLLTLSRFALNFDTLLSIKMVRVVNLKLVFTD